MEHDEGSEGRESIEACANWARFIGSACRGPRIT